MAETRTLVMTIVEVSWDDASGTLRIVPGRLEDKSAGGACVWVKTPITVGSRLRIQWRFEQFSATAKYCRSEGNEYLVGVQRDAAANPTPGSAGSVEFFEQRIRPVLVQHCYECHDAEAKKGGLDLTALEFQPDDSRNFAGWVKVFDRVSAGEMPPKKKARPAAAELEGAYAVAMEAGALVVDATAKAEFGHYQREDMGPMAPWAAADRRPRHVPCGPIPAGTIPDS